MIYLDALQHNVAICTNCIRQHSMLHGPIPQNANAPQPLPLVVRCCEASHVDVTSHPTRGPGLWVWDTQTGLKKGKSGYGKSGGYRCEFLLQGYQL